MHKICVLVVEDDENQRELYTLLLEMEGFTVRSVTNGQNALLELQQRLPDVILTDLAMPNMDGLEFVQLVKEKKEFAHIPIVVMTAYNDYYLKWAECIGAHATISKPLDPERLFATVVQALQVSP